MKKITSVFAFAAASLLSAGAMAQAYVVAGAGIGHVGVDCTLASPCDNSNVAFKLQGGYGFGNGLAAELGYISFGKSKFRVLDLNGETKVGGFIVGAAYNAEVAKDFGLTARLGLARLRTKGSGEIGNFIEGPDSQTHTKPYLGLAANYAVAKNVKIEAAADFSRAKWDDDTSSVRAFTLGVRYGF